jgi:DGQHR domain-containing protein
MGKANTSKIKKKTSKALSPEELARRNLQRRHRREIREVFSAVGFLRVEGASDKEFTYDGVTSDFDDVFILENIIVFAEYTTSNDIAEHAKKKYLMYDRIRKDDAKFVSFARGAPLGVAGILGTKYSDNQIRVVLLYCSLNTVQADLKSQIDHALFMDYSIVRYFRLLSKTVRKSAQHEILAFLGIEYKYFADRALNANASPRDPFNGSVLPEHHSKFPTGYKVVSFYIQPSALLSRAYVLRRDGWRDRSGLYQRMILRAKLDSIRKYLVDQQRVFVNNIIVTLPSGTKILDADENTINTTTIYTTQPAIISIPSEFNSIGIIDGQHRVFSYYEGGANENVIGALRSQQNLLVTGIIYPDNVDDLEKTRFEAGLFLEINSTQSNAKSELKQAINQLIRPFLADSIAREVLDRLNDGQGALSGKFSQSFFDSGGLRTTSVVSYGLRPLVRPSAPGPLFARWTDADRDTFVSFENDAARKRYIDYCASQIGLFFAAARSRLPADRWTSSRTVQNRLLTPTVVNGLIGAMRQALDAGVEMTFENLRDRLTGLEAFPFENYRSSQYTVMSTALFKTFFVSADSLTH